jgi:PAS domain S-box-containing protein
MIAELTTVPDLHPPDSLRRGLLAVEAAPLPMAAFAGPSHIVSYVNAAFCRLLGKSADQLLDQPCREVLPGKGECAAWLDEVFRTGQSMRRSQQERTEPHPVFWSYTLWPVRVEERPAGVMMQVTEITQLHETTLAMNEALLLGSVRQHELTEAANWANRELKREIIERTEAEAALQLARAELLDRAGQLEGLVTKRTAELTATNQQLETFVYSIAHDLRAPLRAMQGFASMLVAEAGGVLNVKGRDYADRISKSAQFMDALLLDLLDFSRVSQQRVELTAVKLETVVAAVLARLEKDIRETNARVENVGPWPVVLAHEPTLAQAFFNLVSNALKFVTTDGPPVVRLRAESHAEFLRVWVEDNGPGIAPDHQAQIFRIFTRLEGGKYAGTGIGLAIVQKGVERMGGRVGVESAAGHGSRFWFELRKG